MGMVAVGIAGAGIGAGVIGTGIAGTGVASAATRAHPHLVRTAAHPSDATRTTHANDTKDAKRASATVHAAKVAGVGTVLVDASGYTLYLFTPDKQSKSTCSGSCAAVWHPLTVRNKPVAGSGTKAALLGTVKDADGKTQVTYDKWPLYTFTVDSKPGQASGQGVKSFGGQWWAVTPAGKEAGATSSSATKHSSTAKHSSATKHSTTKHSTTKPSSKSKGSSGYSGY